MTTPTHHFTSYLALYEKAGRFLAPLALFVWLLLHVTVLILYLRFSWGQYLLTPFILGSSLFYVRLIHRLDERLRGAGVRSLLRTVRAASSPRKKPQLKEGALRSSIRLQTVAIGGGFGTTFFILVLQMYREGFLDGAEWGVTLSMLVLFPTSAILNLLQLVLYDFLEAPDWHNAPFRDGLAAFCRKRLRTYRFFAWHCMITPSILALSLYHPVLCFLFNLGYGLVLRHYYFLTPRRMKRIKQQVNSPGAGLPETGTTVTTRP